MQAPSDLRTVRERRSRYLHENRLTGTNTSRTLSQLALTTAIADSLMDGSRLMRRPETNKSVSRFLRGSGWKGVLPDAVVSLVPRLLGRWKVPSDSEARSVSESLTPGCFSLTGSDALLIPVVESTSGARSCDVLGVGEMVDMKVPY